MEDLKKIVAEDSKQRYAFSQDGAMIRANQGHSIPVDVELPVATPPAVLYHGTTDRFLADILAQGLKPKSRLYVHLSPDVETATSVGARHGKPVILSVDTARMAADGFTFYRSVNGVWLIEAIPAKYLTILKQ